MANGDIAEALRDKRSELSGVVARLEEELVGHRADLAHLDATMRLFDPEFRPEQLHAEHPRVHNTWFRAGECRRLIYDVLRMSPQPLATREVAERVMTAKALPITDDRQRMLIQKVVLGSLNQAKETIKRIEVAGVVKWQVDQVA
ncbi:MAG: hypothetical protein ACRET0_13340 [Steroidobacteraceae bacterium]